jgi:DNA-directed RNA polymerase
MPLLPQEVQQQGVSVEKSSSSFLMVVGVINTNGTMTQEALQKSLNSRSLPQMRSPRPWRAGIGRHYWRWRSAHARPQSRMQPSGWQKK